MSTLTIPATGTDQYGFPVGNCGRCGGSGTYPSIAWNGVCLDCNGGGRRYISLTVQNIAVEFINAYKAAGRVSGCRAEPGMQVRRRAGGTTAWRTVTAVEDVEAFVRVLTFDDGTTEKAVDEDWDVRRGPEWETRRVEAVEQATAAEAAAAERRAEAAARKEAKRQAMLAAREAEFITWSAAHGELIAELAPFYRHADYDPNPTRSRFLTELAQQIIGCRAALTDDQITGARKALAGLAATDRRRVVSRHAGAIGAKVTITGTITRRRSGEGTWGYWYLTVVVGTGDDEGITVTTFSQGEKLLNMDEGDALTITGTVKEHTERDGFRETALAGRITVTPAR